MHFHIPKVHFRCIISLSLSLKPIFISFRHFWIKDQHSYISLKMDRTGHDRQGRAMLFWALLLLHNTRVLYNRMYWPGQIIWGPSVYNYQPLSLVRPDTGYIPHQRRAKNNWKSFQSVINKTYIIGLHFRRGKGWRKVWSTFSNIFPPLKIHNWDQAI